MSMSAYACACLIWWIKEREKVRLAKEAGEPKPWTDDPVILKYRFCNVHREDDKVTRWIAKYIRTPYANDKRLPMMLALARHINRIETLEHLFVKYVDWSFRPNSIPYSSLCGVLNNMKAGGEQIYGAAYVMRAESNPAKEWFSWPKHEYIINIVAGLVWDKREELRHQVHENGMEGCWNFLRNLYGWGEFMAFQVTVDLRHTPFLSKAPDLRSFVAFGPGTRRGLNRMFGRDLNQNVNRKELHENLRTVQCYIDGQTGFELEPYDVANCMCELDKYMRGGGKQRYPGA